MDPNILVEGFRQAAMGMRSWAAALDAMAQQTRARIGQLSVGSSSGEMILTTMSGCGPDEVAAYFAAAGPDPRRNPRTRAIIEAPLHQCVGEADFADRLNIANSPIYAGLFRRSDVPASLHVKCMAPNGEIIVLGVQRSISMDAVDPEEKRLMEAIAPGAAAAIMGAVVLGVQLGGELLQTAEHLSGAAMLLNHDMALVSLSPKAEMILQSGEQLLVRAGRLGARNARDQQRLSTAVRAASGRLAMERHHSAVSLHGEGAPAMRVDIFPLPERIAGPLSRAEVLVTITMPRAVPVERAVAALRVQFGLTGAEAAVALMLSEGLSVSEIAFRRGSVRETVRSQLKMLFEKVGVRRQAELVLKVERCLSTLRN